MPKKTSRQVEVLTLDAALQAVNAAIAAGRRAGVNVSVAVYDPTLTELAFVHDDGATPHSAHTSRRKAQTAASTRKATGWMGAELALTLPLASGNLLTNIPGGLPIRVNGTLLGAIGIAGGTVEQDAEIAKVTLVSIGADAIA